MKLAARVALFLAVFASLAAADDTISGRWSFQLEGQSLTIVFDEAGDYIILNAKDELVQEGTYALAEGALALVETGGEPILYELRRDGGSLILSGADLASPLVLFPASDTAGRPTPTPRPDEDGGPSLVGRWVHTSAFLAGWIVLLPEGRYFSTLTVPGVEQTPEQGTYVATGSTLTIRSGGAEVTYEMSVAGDRMILSGGNLTGPLDYVKEAGSEERVVAEARESDAAKAREDDQWRARFPVGSLKEGFAIPQLGELPGDPRWNSVFEGATVFQSPQAYVWFSRMEYMWRPGQGPAGREKGSSKWFFQSNGRVYLASTLYIGSVPPPDVEQPFWGLYYIESKYVTEGWGRYRIASDDTFHVELDDGSAIDATFLDGRRNLFWEKAGDRCGNVVWEQEALDRELNKDR